MIVKGTLGHTLTANRLNIYVVYIVEQRHSFQSDAMYFVVSSHDLVLDQ